MKRIVAYYSLDGNTEYAAQEIAKGINAELLRIEPVKDIPREGNKKFMVGGMQATFGLCPKIRNTQFDPTLYDEIIVGTPVWAGKCAPSVRSFIKKFKINQLVTAVFTCSGGGDNESCISNLNKLLPNIKCNAALADKNNNLSEKNDEKINAFVEDILHGE